MTLEERRQYLTTMLERHKARAYDLREQLKETDDSINQLIGAMETVANISAVEKKAAAEEKKD